jgi:hypothetical protein
VHRWPWQSLLLVHDHPPECVAKALPSDLHGLWIASREMLREALSRLAWAHSKAVERMPTVGNSPDGELARAADD